jgi:putative hydrolase of the HAD superfamily
LIRAVLFDAAGTLIEPAEPVGETYARLAGEYGVAVSPWRIGDAFRRCLAGAEPMVFPGASPEQTLARERAWWRELVRRAFLAADSAARFRDFEAFFERLWSHYACAAAWSARPGARELLARLRARGLRTAVVSNFDRRLPGILAGLGLSEALDAVVLASDAGVAKPDPGIFARALAKLGVAPEEAIFVGDDARRDLAGARAAGLEGVDASRLATLLDLRLPGEGAA